MDAETSCCSFFSFTITPVDVGAPGEVRTVAVDVEVPPARTDVLDALLDRAGTVRAG